MYNEMRTENRVPRSMNLRYIPLLQAVISEPVPEKSAEMINYSSCGVRLYSQTSEPVNSVLRITAGESAGDCEYTAVGHVRYCAETEPGKYIIGVEMIRTNWNDLSVNQIPFSEVFNTDDLNYFKTSGGNINSERTARLMLLAAKRSMNGYGHIPTPEDVLTDVIKKALFN